MSRSPSKAELVEVVPERRNGCLTGPWSGRTRLEKTLLVTSCVGLFACVATIGALVNTTSSTGGAISFAEDSGIKNGRLPVYKSVVKGKEVDVCSTPECVIAASDILQSLDRSTNPCENFYQFACGGWMNANPVPGESSRWGQFDVLDKELSNALSTILDEEISNSDPLPLNQAKYFYHACMDTANIEEVGLSPLVELIDHFGGWPMASSDWSEENYDFQNEVALSRKETTASYIIYTWVFADQKNTQDTAIYLDQTSLGMPRSILTSPANYQERIEAYKTFMKTTATLLLEASGKQVDLEDLQSEIDETFDFEMRLANITSPPEDRRDIERMYNPMTISELNGITESKLRWLDILKTTFESTDIVIDDNSRVIVQEVEYFKSLAHLIEETNPRVLANYLGWRFVLSFGDDTTEAMRDAKFQYSMVANGVNAREPRWKECSDKTNGVLGMAVGVEYVNRYFSEQAKVEASAMVEDIRASFKELLDKNEWMDDATKPFAVEKADAITKFIAYPDWFGTEGALEDFYSGLSGIANENHFNNVKILSNYYTLDELDDFGKPSDRTRWFSPPTIVNAYYLPEYNSITFPAGILQPPFYRANTIQAINYGGIGQVIGHEITHGFDDQGRQNDKEGNAIPWWTNQTLEAFKGKAQCVIDQYSSYRVPEIDHLMPNATLNGINTQGENIADNGGLREALLAYYKFVERNGEEPRLPGLEYLTPYQIFFLSNSNIWCNSITAEGLLNQVLTDPHSPAKFRVQVPMSNMQEFSDIWGCTSDNAMNPQDKCVVW